MKRVMTRPSQSSPDGNPSPSIINIRATILILIIRRVFIRELLNSSSTTNTDGTISAPSTSSSGTTRAWPDDLGLVDRRIADLEELEKLLSRVQLEVTHVEAERADVEIGGETAQEEVESGEVTAGGHDHFLEKIGIGRGFGG